MRHFRILVVCVLATALGLARGPEADGLARKQSPAKPQTQTQAQSTPGNALTETQIRDLAERVIAAQHNDDVALEEFERVEHHTVYSGPSRRLTDSKVFRVVPTGTGTLKLLLKDGTTPVDVNFYRRELRDWEQVLEIAANPDDPRQQAVYAKWQRKIKERKDLVDASRRAFRVASSGQEMLNGRACEVLELEPNPSFVPHSTFENVFTGTRAKVWIDPATSQIVHAEADIIHDISFGAGILGKLYRGGHFTVDNSEIAPGVWLPTRAQFDYSARKFLFAFESHEVTETSRYHRLGKPAQALEAVRQELVRGAPVPADP
jgi:hypothetical protein